MPRLTLGERLERSQKRKAKAMQDEATLLKLQENERTRRLIAVGALAAGAGIDGLPLAALFDRFLKIALDAKDPKTVARWEREGARPYARDFERAPDERVVAIGKFSNKIAPEISASLRQLGFRWNRFLLQWEGKVDFASAKKTVEAAGGTIREVRPDGPPPPGPASPAPGRPGKGAVASRASAKPRRKRG